MNQLRSVFILVICLLGHLPTAFAQGGSLNDIDTDAITDLFQTKIATGNNVQWYVRSSVSSTITDKGTFAKKIDFVAPIDWTGVPSLTKISKSGENLIWTAKRASDGTSIGSFTFGKSNYFVVTGADFDGSLMPDKSPSINVTAGLNNVNIIVNNDRIKKASLKWTWKECWRIFCKNLVAINTK